MQIAIQIFVVFMEVLAGLQKKKSSILICYTIDNIALVLMYLLFKRFATACICVIAVIRTIVFLVFSIKNIKPNIFVLILFEIAFVITVIITWQDVFDLLPMFASMTTCFASWQDKTSILRIGFIINPLLYTIYKIIIKAYISIIPELMLLTTNLVSLIYYNVLKNEKPILVALKEKFGFASKTEKMAQNEYKEYDVVVKQNSNAANSQK